MEYTTINEAVQSLMWEADEKDDRQFNRYMDMAISGLRDLSFMLPTNVKTVYIDYDFNLGYIDLPPDCQQWTKVGDLHNGCLHLLWENPDMPLARGKDNCGNLQKLPVCNCCGCEGSGVGSCGCGCNDWGWYEPFWNYGWGGNLYTLYGVGGGQSNKYSFREDRETNRIQFDSCFKGEVIYLEYQTNGINLSLGKVMIPLPAKQALIEWISWRKAKKGSPEGMAAKRDFVIEKGKLMTRMFAFTINEFRNASARRDKQTPKLG
jgi:hypothetical protein